MKNFIYIIYILCLSVNAQQIVKESISVTKGKVTTISVKGEVLQFNNLPDEIEIDSEQLELNGSTLINLKTNKEFKGEQEATLITNQNKFYSVLISYAQKLDKPYYFFEENQVSVNQGNTTGKDVENKVNDNSQVNNESKNEENIYLDDAKRINSMLDKSYTKTKRRTNNIMINLYDVFTRNGKLFLRFNIDNQSPYDFNVSAPSFKVTEAGEFTKKSSPEEIKNYIYVYDDNQNIVEAKKKLNKTFVFDAFTIERGRVLKISFLDEETSTEEYYLLINDAIVNNPKIFSFKEKNERAEQQTEKTANPSKKKGKSQ